ncbi:RAMP superfamily CRISPR-associated protein [Sulfolobus acidocaldarius]|uniref:CRISPR type III-associated protein domain-containing protein n=4 Tax=Sulfolobus acidocaldarius TaxID=2285 RepID=Q4J7N6_SULAC|nr:RAMP superfamily CRISPR-associated protein [Sulfolobus acidocaldarius]AAY81196.1 hypothetical protein Saci_1893 [Sulfolobus acidocaldarius DSM 639]AGE71817.1 hypothetical protein SacN8_09285 [Sulfolobus acidocaldarius N8]AGE74088.1 hypothetical protein SacRon12I_09305 [Sulfolobus acidocaldarius Ron12/I]ALU29989.1 hypothetical protein ATY89_08630 [Sulfolobus acidocaldarius]ALU30679.1 hypothetical protein ATZ20_00040 [Sulfolobus acidocaldarius]
MIKVIPVLIKTMSITRIGSTGVYFDYASADIVTYKLPLQDSNEVYYIPAIPATSFKGLLRSTYEKYLRWNNVGYQRREVKKERIKNIINEYSVNHGDTVKELVEEMKSELRRYISGGLIKNTNLPDDITELIILYLNVTGWNSKDACYVTSDLDQCVNLSIIEDEGVRKKKELWLKLMERDQICKVCNVLGSSGVRGKVKFTDLIAVDPFPVYIERSTHIAINRLTGTAEKGKIFTEEIIPPGVKFLGFVAVLDNSILNQVREMLRILKTKAERGEVWIGGRGTAGYGTFEMHLPPEIIEFSTHSLFRGRRLGLKESEPAPNPTIVNGIISKLYPSSFTSSLVEVTEGEVEYEVVIEGEGVTKVKSVDDLKKITSELDKSGKKYQIKTHGEYHL